jgi:hypothetical protein
MPLDGKVMKTAKLPQPTNEMAPRPLNPESGKNPSLANGNNPPRTPTVHGSVGPSQMGPGMPGPKIGR